MAVLKPEEYDISYFDGSKTVLRHNAGYDKYERFYRGRGPNSTGEHFRDIAKTLFDKYQLNGKKVLEIGCAKGFLVKDLRDFGADAYGIDISQYAIDSCEPEVAPYLTVADARTFLANYVDNEFDFVFSLRFFECLTDDELEGVILELNRIAKVQYHRTGSSENVNFYVNRTKEILSTLGFKNGTEIADSPNLTKTVTK